MFKQKQQPTIDKRIQDAIEQFGRLTVDEVLTSVDNGSVDEALIMFQEFEQYTHIDVLKFLYYGYEPEN
jgi:hypothetical protein